MVMARSKVRLLVVGFLLLSAILSSYAAFAKEETGVLAVSFLDVGQGDAIYIQTPSGRDILIDGGPPNGAVAEALSSVMSPLDREIDVVVVTHLDSDHVGGLVSILDRYEVKTIMESGNQADSAIAKTFHEMSAQEIGATRYYARSGSVINFGDGVTFQILFPDRDPALWESNTSSLVGLLKYGSTSVFLSGDSPVAVERHLVSVYKDGLRSDILKLGHHGSVTSTSDELLSAVAPTYAVVSAGANNSYGHPSADVIRSLLKRTVCVVRTDEAGTITFVSDGNSWLTTQACSKTLGPLSTQ